MAFAVRRAALALAGVLLAPGPVAGQAAEQTETSDVPAIVGGSIVDHETGQPLAGATVSLLDQPGDTAAPMVRTSDEEGRFEFRAVPPGTYTLAVASLGYTTLSDLLEVTGETEVRLTIRLSVSPLRLEPIVVVTARRLEFMDGFEERRARDRVHTAFFTAAEIEAKNPRMISELFEMIPSAYVQPGLVNFLRVAGVPSASAWRGGCLPDVWVDGFLAVGVPFDEMYPPDQIEAIELYTIRHDVPTRFRGPRGCGALVIWLRERGPDEPFLPTWQRWLLVLGALGATLLLAR